MSMTADPKYQAALALHRFGLGPKAGTVPGSIAAIASDPRGALLAELEKPGIGQIVDPTLMTAAKASMAAFNFREARQAAEILKKMDEETKARAMGSAMEAKPVEPPVAAAQTANAAQPQKPATPPKPEEPNIQQRIVRGEARARFIAARTADIGFVERLVWFWSNHFCVSSFVVLYTCGGYEREAIRPHVLGRFADMLVASASHCAMVQYLDNWRSVGPKSIAGLINKVGLNENYARELLELHTLGVRTGYTQDDVIALARVLTGWTIDVQGMREGNHVAFKFAEKRHDFGDKVLLGQHIG